MPWLNASACRMQPTIVYLSQPSLVYVGVLKNREVGRREWLSRDENKVMPCLWIFAYWADTQGGYKHRLCNLDPPDHVLIQAKGLLAQHIAGIELEPCCSEKLHVPVVPRVDILYQP
jgi:hypothetical protein